MACSMPLHELLSAFEQTRGTAAQHIDFLGIDARLERDECPKHIGRDCDDKRRIAESANYLLVAQRSAKFDRISIEMPAHESRNVMMGIKALKRIHVRCRGRKTWGINTLGYGEW